MAGAASKMKGVCMTDVIISGTGIYVPPHVVTNDELVTAFNAYVDRFNAENADAIAAGDVPAKQHSSVEFIEKASGIKQRHYIEKTGVTDPERMLHHLPEGAFGDENTPSLQAGMGIEAAKIAMDQAGVTADDIDMVICSSAVMTRSFPAMAIEIQKFLGIKGAGFDMVMGCSSATYGMIQGYTSIKSGLAKRVLMVNPEIFSTMVNFTDRDSHFIFGDIASACILETAEGSTAPDQWRIDSLQQETELSQNIVSNYGPLTRYGEDLVGRADMYFVQQGRKVFKELLPMVTSFIERQLDEQGLKATDLDRMWLHQANINMNMYAAKKLLGREPTREEAPVVLERFGNIAGAGSLVAFHEHRDGLSAGDRGLLCSFGAGYSIGGILVTKL